MHFQELSNLETLELNNNAISRIGRFTFISSNNLWHLKLDNNEINEHIRKISSLSNLTQVSFVNNKFLKEMTKLKIVDMSGNLIGFLSDHLFTYNSQLEVIVANSNKLTELSQFTMQPLTNLQQLSLAANQISQLHPETFKFNQKMTSLSFQSNFLTRIDADVFRPIPQLQILFLTANRIIEIDHKVINVLKSLRNLHLSGNSCIVYDFNSIEVNELRRFFIRCYINYEQTTTQTSTYGSTFQTLPTTDSSTTTESGAFNLIAVKGLTVFLITFVKLWWNFYSKCIKSKLLQRNDKAIFDSLL